MAAAQALICSVLLCYAHLTLCSALLASQTINHVTAYIDLVVRCCCSPPPAMLAALGRWRRHDTGWACGGCASSNRLSSIP